MSKRPSNPSTYQRQTYPLQCTHSTNPARLDYGSHLRLHWAAKWVQLHGGLKTPQSGLIRRALEVYVRHLESLPPERAIGEVRNVKFACHGSTPAPDEQEAAEARLEAASEVLPLFDVVLLGAHQVAARAEMFKRLDQLNDIPTKKARTA